MNNALYLPPNKSSVIHLGLIREIQNGPGVYQYPISTPCSALMIIQLFKKNSEFVLREARTTDFSIKVLESPEFKTPV